MSVRYPLQTVDEGGSEGPSVEEDEEPEAGPKMLTTNGASVPACVYPSTTEITKHADDNAGKDIELQLGIDKIKSLRRDPRWDSHSSGGENAMAPPRRRSSHDGDLESANEAPRFDGQPINDAEAILVQEGQTSASTQNVYDASGSNVAPLPLAEVERVNSWDDMQKQATAVRVHPKLSSRQCIFFGICIVILVAGCVGMGVALTSSSASTATSIPASEEDGTKKPVKDDVSIYSIPQISALVKSLPSYMLVSLKEPASPQSMAMQYLGKLTDLENYAIPRLLHMYVYRTLYYSFQGVLMWKSPLPSLEEVTITNNLTVVDNNLHGVVPLELGLFSGLRVLDLSRNRIEGNVPSSIGLLSDLAYLDLSDTELDGTVPSQIGQLVGLEYLNLSTNKLFGTIPATLAMLNQLTRLDLSKNDFLGRVDEELLGRLLSRSQSLNLQENPQLGGTLPATGTGSMSLVESIPLQALNMSHCSFTGPVPYHFWHQASSLTVFDLSHNLFTGSLEIDSSSRSMQSLAVLDLSSNSLNGAIPLQLGSKGNSTFGLPENLVRLSLSDNQFTGPIPTELGNLHRLEHIDLSGNSKLTGTIPTELEALPNLQYLGLSGTQLTGTVPPALCALLSPPTPLENPFVLEIDCSNISCDCGCTCIA